MNKAELIKAVSEESGHSQKEVSAVLDAFVDIVTNAVANGDKVKVVDFGTFSAKERAPKLGVNPKNPTEKINIPAKVVPTFSAGKGFKNKVSK
jgi:DNA-binding protein HU-beta